MPPRWRVELAGNVRTWLEQAAGRVLDRLQPPEVGLAYEGSGHDRDRPHDLAARMREAWVLRDVRSAKRHQTNPPPRRAWPTACAPGRRRWTTTKSPPAWRRSGRAGRWRRNKWPRRPSVCMTKSWSGTARRRFSANAGRGTSCNRLAAFWHCSHPFLEDWEGGRQPGLHSSHE